MSRQCRHIRREVERELQLLGATEVRFDRTKNHQVALFQVDGHPLRYVFINRESDSRSLQNTLATLRRVVRAAKNGGASCHNGK